MWFLTPIGGPLVGEGAGRTGGMYDTKTKAITAARGMARNQITELVVHGRDGRTQLKDGHDPYAPKG